MEKSQIIMSIIIALFVMILMAICAIGVANCLGIFLGKVIYKERINQKSDVWRGLRLLLYVAITGGLCFCIYTFDKEIGRLGLNMYLILTLFFFSNHVCHILAEKYAHKTFFKFKSSMYTVTFSFITGLIFSLCLRLPWYGGIGLGIAFSCITGGLYLLIKKHFRTKRQKQLASEEISIKRDEHCQQFKEDVVEMDNFELLLLYVDMLKILEPSGHHCSKCLEKGECAYNGTQDLTSQCFNGCDSAQTMRDIAAKELEHRGLELPDKDSEPSKLFEQSGDFGLYVSISINIGEDD